MFYTLKINNLGEDLFNLQTIYYIYETGRSTKPLTMVNIHDVCDYVIKKTNADEAMPLNNLKLQKLLYYIQAWHLAFYREKFFDGSFQAWVHGPVNREIYDRFNPTKYLYSDLSGKDIKDEDFLKRIDPEDQEHIDNVLDTYLKYTGAQLETLTHKELPWIAARKGYGKFQNCEVEIDNELIQAYYSSLIDVQDK